MQDKLVEEFTDSRAKRLAKNLALLSDVEFKRFQELTDKKSDRIARLLGFDTATGEWRLINRTPEELNAFLFTHIRSLAAIIEHWRRYVANYRHQPHYATGPGRY